VSVSRSVARGTLRLLSGQLGARALDFALYLLLARKLGVETFGLYMFALSFTLLFSVLADFGVSTVLTREVARDPRRTRALLADALALKLGFAAVTLAVVLGVAAATRTPPATLALVATFCVAMLLNSVALVLEGLLRAVDRAGSVGISLLVASATGLAAAAVLVLGGRGVAGGAAAYLAAAAAHAAAAAWLTRDLWRAPAAGAGDGAAGAVASARWSGRLAMLREAGPLAVSWLFIALYFRIDAVMLHALKDERAVGLYGGIYRVFEVFAMLAVAFRSVLFPVMARAADGPREALAVLCRKSLRAHLLFTVLVAVFFTLEARPLVTLILGADYAAAAPGLAILIWALPGSFMADTLLHLLIAQRRQAAGTWAVGATALFNVLLNFALIPRFSFLGASAATVASELLCFALLFALFRRGVPGIALARVAWRPLLAGGAAAAALAAAAPRVPGGLPGLALAGAGSLAAYAAALAAVRGVGREDLALLRDLLPAARGRAARGGGA